MRLSAAIARRPTFVPGTTGTTDTPAAERHLAGATFALAAGLVLFGNAFSSLPTGLQDHLGVVTAKVVLAAAIAAGTVWTTGISLRDIGICWEGCVRQFALGATLAAALAAPIVVYFTFPAGMPGGEIEYGVVDGKSTAAFLIWMLVTLPLATALFEEVTFRGCLQSVAVRTYGVAAGIALMALAFTLWHGVINFKTIQDTNAAGGVALPMAAYTASAVGLFVGGVIFGVLRHRTGSVVAPFAFHWLIVLAMNTTLFVLSRT